eukprot:TRINITY_DN67188_c8_g7_i1.p1 TRINITY_DN67188_c8_g7~~TRINITY_DN67188_c8_g7_i1.p1  ORF type:complete len:313 (+),score=13.13 TRINITY_DN67188_c8_g7_i1:29-967(+)
MRSWLLGFAASVVACGSVIGCYKVLNRQQRKEKALFFRLFGYPMTARQTSAGLLPTPYYVYDGEMVVIGCTLDGNQARKLLQNEPDVEPRPCESGRVPCQLIFANFTDASIGPHTEAQFSICVRSRGSQETLPNDVLAGAMGTASGALCYSLFNSTENCLAYNRELLGLDPRASCGESVFTATKDRITIHVNDAEGDPLVHGTFLNPGRPHAKLPNFMPFVKRVGLWKTLYGAIFGNEGLVVNRAGTVLQSNKGARCIVQGTQAVALVEPEVDKFDILSEQFVPAEANLDIQLVSYFPSLFFAYFWQDKNVH